MPIRPALIAVSTLALASLAAAPARAWPDKPIRSVVTFAASGASDSVARTISEPASR